MEVNANLYTPAVTEDVKYATFLVVVHQCGICKHGMVVGPRHQSFKMNTFPNYVEAGFSAQARRAGLRIISDHQNPDGEYVCAECVQSSKEAIFKCCLCNGEKQASKRYDSTGDPAEHRCLDCYAVIPAKDWDEKTEELERDHQYDFM